MQYVRPDVGAHAYIARDISEASQLPKNKAACELIRRHSETKHVLDLGCSDGVGTFGLGPDYTALGIDVDEESVRVANAIARARGIRGEGPRYEAVHANLLDLPNELKTRIASSPFDCVVALDVLEHFTPKDAIQVMISTRALLRPHHTLIVSMPIISALSVETYRALADVVRNRRRPATGLFDSTHLILRGKAAHKRLFRQAGYSVIRAYQTDNMSGVTGDWPWQVNGNQSDQLRADMKRRRAKGARVAALITSGYARAHRAATTQRMVEALVVFQGLYVLVPDGA